jgi:hypothetical protein
MIRSPRPLCETTPRSDSKWNDTYHGVIATSSAASSDSGTGGPTALQMGFAVIILGTSAGLTLYTKKTQSMLNSMEKYSHNQAIRKGPPKFGPMTKAEWEKMKPRIDDDDL